MIDKRQLRVRLRAARTVASGSPIPLHPAFLDLLRPEMVVAAYLPTGGEADPAPYVDAARAAGCPIVLPHVVDRALPLRFLLWGAGAPLADGPVGLRQPEIDAEELPPALILTPLVGFDRAGNRLGQGAGHYDRAFATHPEAIRIGIAYAVQQVPAIPADAWDVPLHHIATEKEWITPMGSDR